MLELRSVSHVVSGRPLLDAVTVDFRPGEISVVLGLSSEERRAVSRLLRGQARPSSGFVRSLSRSPSRRRRIRMMALGAEGHSLKGRTVRSSVERLVRKVAGALPAVTDLESALQRTGLEGRADLPLKALNPEMRIRATLAAALAAQPDVLIINDPFEGINSVSGARLLEEFSLLLPETGAAVIYLASEGREALVISGMSVVIDRGRLAQSGPAEDVALAPVNLSVARSVSSPCLNAMQLEIFADGIRTNDGARFHPPGGLDLPAEGRITLAFRPEDLALERTSSQAFRVVVRSDGDEMIAGRHFLRFQSAHGLWRAPAAGNVLSAGLMKSVYIEPDRIMAFDIDGQAVSVRSTH
ncbi:MAG: hypothetical protein KGS00_06930 [Alphaproteobacteria bacterium]|nr:hypothetical protein [Alphaproteobacteria bacterium]